ncbi:MAG: hypothetical protein ACLQVI_33700 [Polyangiaceae bacterium]
MIHPTRLVAEALRGTGLNVVGSCGIDAYDRRAPRGYKSDDLMARARGLIVVGSAGGELWAALHDVAEANPEFWSSHAHPLDTYVASALDRGDEALARARIGSRRFDPRLGASPTLDFRALGEIAGLGSMGPFGLLIHPEHGPWWALRGAWFVDVEVQEPSSHPAPCAGCHAPCLGETRTQGIVLATPAVRGRCVVGGASRYSDEQIAYHYDRDATLKRLRTRAPRAP